MKVLLALLFGSSLLQLLQHFPKPLLGALLLVSGLELAASARKESEQRGCCFMLLTAAAIMGLNNTAIGFAVGWGGFVFVAVFERGQGMVQKWWQLRALQQYKPLAAKDRCASPV
jgi:MFS superfamily sulfate permease-like transporter